jgi:hypothetical protein
MYITLQPRGADSGGGAPYMATKGGRGCTAVNSERKFHHMSAFTVFFTLAK